MSKFVSESTITADSKRVGLLQAIGNAVTAYTTQTPMTPDEVVGCLAFMSGAAIASMTDATEGKRRKYKEMAEANIRHGLDAEQMLRRKKAKGLIIQQGIQ